MFIVYGKPHCQWCEKAKALLGSMQKEYQYVDVTQNEDALMNLKAQGIRSVPQVYVDGEHIGGYGALVDWLQGDYQWRGYHEENK